MTDTAFKALQSYILDTTSAKESETILKARQDADEFGLAAPDAMTGALLTLLAAEKKTAITVSPASSVVGLHLLAGMAEQAILTCIDPDAEHQRQAKAAFREAGYRQSAIRFLPSRPLDVMHRLATDSYELVYGDVTPTDLDAFIDAAWPLLVSGGMLILADSLLDGAVASDRPDRDVEAARAADEKLAAFEDAFVARLPLGAGLTLVYKR